MQLAKRLVNITFNDNKMLKESVYFNSRISNPYYNL